MAALRVGIVGAGGITRHHAPSWKALGATVSVHELEGAAGLADEFDLTVAATMAELLGTVDMVDICTPAARAAGVLVLPAHVVRFFGQYAAMQAAVAAGRIGRPAILRFIRGGSGPTRTGSSTRRCPVA